MRDRRPAFQWVPHHHVFSDLPTPARVIGEEPLTENGRILDRIAVRTETELLLDADAFPVLPLYSYLRPFVTGVAVHSPQQAKEAARAIASREIHITVPDGTEEAVRPFLQNADHVLLPSVSALDLYGPALQRERRSIGLQMPQDLPAFDVTPTRTILLDGLALSMQDDGGPADWEPVLQDLETRYETLLPNLKWIEVCGAVEATGSGYDSRLLSQLLMEMQRRWNVMVYWNPLSAWTHNIGYLIEHVTALHVADGRQIASVDGPLPPDAPLFGALEPGRNKVDVCLEGTDGSRREVSFDHPLRVGSLMVFGNMAGQDGFFRPGLWFQHEGGSFTPAEEL
ncbi:MAG: hypothetical protein PUC71_08075 [Oscillospiraceae bacterium]|nr:hypothetical protein [Oscillospiraceae bacterium]